MEFDFAKNLDFSKVHESYNDLYNTHQAIKRAKRVRRIRRIATWTLIGVGAYAIHNHRQQTQEK